MTYADFVAFFDDAAVFPPGCAELIDAVKHHLHNRVLPAGNLIGPLLLPTDRLDAAGRHATAMGAGDAPIAVGVITPPSRLDEAVARIGAEPPGLRIVGVELGATDDLEESFDALARHGEELADISVYVEVRESQLDPALVHAVVSRGARPKFRTGGATSESFPDSATLARFIRLSVDAGTPFKLTAGLHEAVRHEDPRTGLVHHGFLNIANATAATLEGADVSEVASLLEAVAAEEVRDAFLAGVAPWRRSFISFGTCSASEPLASLRELALLPVDVTRGLAA